MRKVNLLCYYYEDDRPTLNELKQCLDPLLGGGLTSWAETNIGASGWRREVNSHLYTTDILLLLVSAGFMMSEFCSSSKEMEQVAEQYQEGMFVIPIILSSTVDWKKSPIDKFDVLLTYAASASAKNRDEICSSVKTRISEDAEAVRSIWENRAEGPKKWQHEADVLNELRRYAEALADCNEAIRLDSSFVYAYASKGWALNGLEQYNEALAAFSNILPSVGKETMCAPIRHVFQHQNPSFTYAYANRGWALNGLKRYDEALADCDEAIRLDPSNTYAYSNKSWALNGLGKHRQALEVSDKAIQLDDTNVYAYDQKNWALDVLGQHKQTSVVSQEALAACDRAINENPSNLRLAVLYFQKGWVLSKLHQTSEAKQANYKARELGCNC